MKQVVIEMLDGSKYTIDVVTDEWWGFMYEYGTATFPTLEQAVEAVKFDYLAELAK